MLEKCVQCGNDLPVGARFCVVCGKPQNEEAAAELERTPELQSGPPPLPQQQGYPSAIPLPYVPNYLVQSILVTILCCLPFGIPAIIFAAQVNGKLAVGDIEGAKASSDKAKMWCWIAAGVGVVYLFFVLGFQVLNILNIMHQ